MVNSVTSCSRNGLRDWLIQRVSAVILATYALFLAYFFLTHSPLTYDQWQGLFSHESFKVFSALALFALLGHVWVGLWTVFTDYVNCSCLRLCLQVLMVLGLFICLIWGVALVWSV